MTVQATDPRSGWFTFIHHDKPIEYSWNIDQRLEVIDYDKPKYEQVERKRCIVWVPPERLPSTYIEARAARNEAQAACKPQLLALALELVPDAPWDKARGCLVFGGEA